MCTVLTSWDAFPLMLPHQQLHQEMVTFIEPVAKSQSSNKDDCMQLKNDTYLQIWSSFFGYAVLMYSIVVGQIAVTEILGCRI